MQTDIAIRVENVYKSFGETEIINGGTMTVQKGTIYGFLGANGAGKTTIFKLITGLLTPSSGCITVFGKDMAQSRNQLLRQIGSLIEAPTFYEHLSAQENLEIHLAYMGTTGLDANTALKMVGLKNTGSKPVGKFSLGMRQRLGIARALIHKPQILILDEPINGLDPMGIREMRNLFLELVESFGMTILLSSHILPEIQHVADTIGVIVDGVVIKEAALSDIKKQSNENLEDYFFEIMSGGAL